MSRNNKTKKFTPPLFAPGPAQMGPVASRVAASGATNLAASLANVESQQRVLNRIRAAGATHLANSMEHRLFPPSANSAAVAAMFSRGPAAVAPAPAPAPVAPTTTVSASPYISGYNSNNWSGIISGHPKPAPKKGGKRSRKTRRRHRK